MKLRNQIAIAAALVALPILHAATGETARPSFYVTVTGAGRPMILIPGLSSSGDTWAGTVAHYSSHYQCHVLTLAGFAGKPPIEGPLVETVRDDLARYIREKHLEKPVVIGHSLGGFLALWFAEKYPDLPGPVIIVDSLPFLPAVMQDKATEETMRPQAEQMRKGMVAATREQFMKMAEQSIRPMVTGDANYQMIVEWSRQSDQGAVANGMYDLFVHDLRPDTGRVSAPVLVIGTWIGLKAYATREQVEANFRKQFAGVKNLEFVMSENSRHFVMLDDPEEFFRTTDRFLAAHK